MPVALAASSLMDNAEFLAELEALEACDRAPKRRSVAMTGAVRSIRSPLAQDGLGELDEKFDIHPPDAGDTVVGPRLDAGRRSLDFEPRAQFDDDAPQSMVSMTTRVPTFVAALVLLLGLGVGAGGAALVFHARLAMLFR